MLKTPAPRCGLRGHTRYLLAPLLAAIALAALMAHPLAATPSTAAVDAERSTPALAAPPGSGVRQPLPSACWITGDLVGEANPATVAAACTRP